MGFQRVPVQGMQARRRATRGGRMGGAVGMLLLLGLLAIPAVLVFVPSWHVRLAGVTAHGTARLVEQCANTNSDDSTATYVVQIVFTDAHGIQHHDESHWSCTNIYDNGEQLSLWYLPDDPASFLTSGEFTWMAILSVVWLVITVPLVLSVYVMMGRLLVGR
jgi:uncharacterized membrane protein